MNKGRIVILIIILAVGVGLSAYLLMNRAQPPLKSSLAPAFQLMGKPVNNMNKALTRVMPIGKLSEKEYGDAIAARYAYMAEEHSAEMRYLNRIMHHLSALKQKPFEYRVFVSDAAYPNAFAMPGGVIVVTKGLLTVMETEAEVVAILAHEMGHIERSHCLDAVRFQLAAKKIGSRGLGELADFAVNVMARHAYSKTQEDEADDYAYRMILYTPYDPAAVGGAFERFMKYKGERPRRERKANLLRDYFSSHPPMELRHHKYAEKAEEWWKDHPTEKRFRGKSNLMVLKTYYDDHLPEEEWIRNEERIK